MDPFDLFFLLVFPGAIILGIGSMLSAHFKWKAKPTLAQYLEAHPGCKTDRGVRCAGCGSGSIKNWGLNGGSDSRRIFICNHCGVELYRSTS